MALVAPADWKMENEHQQQQGQQQSQQQQQPYPYPVQQQAPWVSAAPFYPPFYQNQHQHQQQPYPLHHPQPVQTPYFDPATNAQLAQWAYQHMMFSQAQAHQAQQRSTASAPASPADYFPPAQLFNPFPSGTPPPPQHHQPPHPHQHHPHHAPGYTQRTASADNPRAPYEGFHPYRRPQPSSSGRVDGERWTGASFQPPYARGDASASSTSVNSSSSSTGGGGGSRQRTSSMQGNGSARAKGTSPSPSTQQQQANTTPSGDGTSRTRKGSASGSSGRPSSHASPSSPHPHHRTTSSSSTASSGGTARPSVSSSTTATSAPSSSSHSHSHSHTHSHSNQQARPVRPSPLSQGSTVARANSNASVNPSANPSAPSHVPLSIHTHTEKRMSRDDSDLATMLEGTALGSAPVKGSGGLKGKLRRALSLGAAHALTEEDEREGGKSPSGTGAAASPSTASPADGADASSTTPPGGSTTTKKRSRAASLFNTRLNASTDNISLSSTMSSASVVIRKIGSIGKLARRNSLAGITSLFKDKNRDRDNNDTATGNPTPTGENDDGTTVAGKKKGKSKRNKDSGGGSGKGAVLEPTISHAVAELDRSGGEWSDASMSGLSPAAKLVRQHTLREKAREAEAQAQAQQAQARVNGSGSGANGVNGTNGANGTDVPVPATWEKNTSTGRDGAYVRKGVGEDGRVVVEDDSDSGSDAEHHDSHSPAHPHAQQGNFISEGWEDDEVWREEEDEDVTVRAPIGAKMTEDVGTGDDEEVVEWARTMRRTIECTRPAKGILKGAGSYDQEVYIQDGIATASRVRSNSYNSHPTTTGELGPLARMPSPDPDHIDGLHRHSHSSGGGGAGGNEPLSSQSSSNHSPTTSSETDSGRSSPHHSTLFSLPNSSAPVLSTIPANATLPRSSTSPTAAKRLVFANSLSVYDTFSATVYDRRSEPATWSRLTPALAQRIKEELNSYKMEEMEVHVCSRMHTQFFI